MAKVHNNIFLRGLTGSLGDQFVIRQTRSGKTIIANKPVFPMDREYTETQKAQQKAFQQATTYAKFAKTQPVYVKKAKGTSVTPYNLAIADWFSGPEVLEIDAKDWNGQTGQTIRVKAQDNFQVANVHILIEDADGNTFEQGEAVQSDTDGLWWVYTSQAQVPLSPAPRVVVTAYDLPHNSDEQSWQYNEATEAHEANKTQTSRPTGLI